MVQVVGFTVDLSLKNGDSVQGKVLKVVDRVLTLEEVTINGTSHSNYEVNGKDIGDLKVIDIPGDLKKKKKKKKEKNTVTNPQPLEDDAIIYASTAPTAADNNNNTPRQKKKLLKRKDNTYSNDEDISWDNNLAQMKVGTDFDFEGSTARFDKAIALEEFASNDNIDASQRLVTSNRLKSPVKTTYDNNENVLSAKSDNWDERTTSAKFVSKNLSDIIDSARAESQKIAKRSPSLDSRGFKIVSASNETLPLATPIQLLEIERQSNENFKISPQLLAENSSRGISSLVIKILGGGSRVSNSNHNLPPLVLLLVGNNRTGAKAFATGRQLTNQGVRVVAYTLIEDSNLDEFDDNVKFQLELFKLGGGKIVSSIKSLKKLLAQIESPVELIIDALQGFDTIISDLWDKEGENAKKIIQWANKSDVTILSIDIPSGIDAGSGLTTPDIENIDAQYVVSAALPLSGLLHAYANGIVIKGDWTHHLVDEGIPSKLFKKGNLRKFDRNWFCGDWTVPMEITET